MWQVIQEQDGWVVKNAQGRIANEHVHKERGQAEQHATMLNAFYRAWGLIDGSEDKRHD